MPQEMPTDSNRPLSDLEHWDEFLQSIYPDPAFEILKDKRQFRDYRKEARPSVKEFYRLNHTYQTYEFVQEKKKQYLGLDKKKMGVWEAMEYLNQLVDDSDPDTDMTQIEHLLQAAEAARHDNQPRWFILTCLIHDLGKILCLWGEPQWAVVGDTFPVGCAFSERIVFPEFFAANPDSRKEEFQSPTGVYSEACGLDAVDLSWGHDEYLYHVVKDHLPPEALYMIRYHSFYPWHKEHAYGHLMNETDRQMLPWVNKFNPYDLYSKATEKPSAEKLRPFYEDLIGEYFPKTLSW
jgi:inositol oxygenase